jgi:hypothetical protein
MFATEFVCTMKGRSASALLKCSTGHFYVTKCQEFTLSNQALGVAFLARNLARHVGLPVPEVEVIQVDQWLLDHSCELSPTTTKPWLGNQSQNLTWSVPGIHRRKKGRLQLGSRYLVEPGQGTIFSYFPENMLYKVRNPEAFVSILAFDMWMNKTDARRALFWRKRTEPQYNVAFVDVQVCLLPSEFSTDDRALDPTSVGLYAHKAVYRHIARWDDFEPFLSRIEGLSRETMVDIAARIPECWRETNNKIPALIRVLDERRSMVRDLLGQYMVSNRDTFPSWGNEAPAYQRRQPPPGFDLEMALHGWEGNDQPGYQEG